MYWLLFIYEHIMIHSEHILLNNALQSVLIYLRTAFLYIVFLQRISAKFVGMHHLIAVKLYHPVALKELIIAVGRYVIEGKCVLCLTVYPQHNKENQETGCPD